MNKKGGVYLGALDKIQYLMLVKGINDTELSIRSGLHKNAVAEWKSGKTKSYLKHLPQIAAALGVKPEALLDDDKNAPGAEAPETDVDIQLKKFIAGMTDEQKQALLTWIRSLNK